LDGIMLGGHDHRDFESLLEGMTMFRDVLGTVHIGDKMSAFFISGAIRQADIIHTGRLKILGYINHFLLGETPLHMLFRTDSAPDSNSRAGIADLFGNLQEESLAI